jgi:ferric-dicitrate binding protein FerR (iron transport regulator)
VQIVRNGAIITIDHNTALSPNDRLRTGPSGATFTYAAEKTRVTLGAASTLGIANDQSGKKLELVAGIVDCEVENQQPGRRLVVATPHALVEVKGTQFRVITAGRLTRVEVTHGVVRVTRLADGATVHVSHGEFVDVGTDATTRPATVPGWPVAQGKNMAEFWSIRIRPAGINE